MRLLKILLIFFLASCLSLCSDKHKNNEESKITKEGLLAAINKFNNAFQEGNTSTLETMITSNYLHTNGNSKSIGKRDWFNYLSKRENRIKSGNLQVIDYSMEETAIEFYGNIAIVTGKIIVTNKENEKVKKNQYRITNVWVNEFGNWKRAGFHDGKIE